MVDEEEVDAIEIGDLVWWQRDEDVPGGILHPPARTFDPDKHYFKNSTIRYVAAIYCGKVRSIGFEYPDFSYALIGVYPDGRLLQVQLNRLIKGVPPDPIPVSQEVQETEVDMDIWGDALP
jgi:hypothetical protein